MDQCFVGIPIKNLIECIYSFSQCLENFHLTGAMHSLPKANQPINFVVSLTFKQTVLVFPSEQWTYCLS